MVDSSDVARVKEAREELFAVLEDEGMDRGVPTVVRILLPMPQYFIRDGLGINEYGGGGHQTLTCPCPRCMNISVVR